MLFTLVLSLALLGAPEELLSDPEARELFEQAQVAFAEERYEDSVELLEKAFLIEPEPLLLYPWAQAERSLGHCDRAVPLYQRFIDTEPDERLATAAQENIDRCREQLQAEAEAEAAAAETAEEPQPGEAADDPGDPEPSATETPQARTDEEPRTRRWYADPVGGVLVGVGLVGVGVGGGLLGAGLADASAAAEQDSNSGYLELRDRAVTRRNAGAAVLSVGAALMIAGVVRYGILARKEKRRDRAAASAWFGPRRSVGVVFTGRF